jgi:hypothetical protein
LLDDTKILGIKGGGLERVLKELCYGKAETLGDVEEVARWWRYNGVDQSVAMLDHMAWLN